MKFMAAIHGVGLDDENGSIPGKASASDDAMMFKDPSYYDSMTQAEKEKETQRMMGLHKQWAAGTHDAMGVGDG